MLIRITNKCTMGCSHCMVEATPDGRHMSRETFEKALDFTQRYDMPVLMLSGGEPLEHPEFFDFVEMAKGACEIVLVLSNGMFLEDENLRNKVLALNVLVQITNDPKYYPKRIPKFDHPNIAYEDALRLITPLGRAIENNIKGTQKAPMCYNLRSIVHATKDFHQTLGMMRFNQKMCSPSINVDGTVVAGESVQCCKIGTTESSDQELVTNLMTMHCNKCGLEDNLSSMHRSAIGL